MTEEQQQELQEAKTFAWAAPLVIPMIQRRMRSSLELLLSDFRAGKTDNLARIAELNAFYSLEKELTQKTEEYRTLEERHATRK